MGDLITITTWPNHHNLFYLVTSSGVTFDVKAQHGNAAIGLAKKPGKKIDYWVGIGDNNQCWIKQTGNQDDGNGKSVHVQNILSGDYYTRFWLQWNANSIRLGQHGEPKPIVTYTTKLPVLKYITFGVLNRNPVHWKFDLPPVLPKFKLDKKISGGKLTWVEADNQLPDEALIGGFETESLYIIRAPHRGSVTPGKFVPSEGGGYIPWGGQALGKGEFEVLCGFDCTWVSTYEDRIPVGAFVGGHSEERHEELYVGRAMHNGHIIPGKVQPSHKVCYIPFEGREIAKKKYEILVEPTKVRSVNNFYLPNVNVGNTSESDSDEADSWHGNEEDESEEAESEEELSFELEDLMAL